MIKNIATIILLFSIQVAFAQEILVIPQFLQNPMDSTTEQNFNRSLKSFFSEIKKGKISTHALTPKRAELTRLQLQKFVNYEAEKDSSASKSQDKQLINVYPISKNEYLFTVSYTRQKPNSNPTLLYIVNLVATKTKDKFTFSIPIDYLTRHWKTQTVGNITYYFRNTIKIDRAKLFDKKNSEIARKMNVKAEKLDFYMTDNSQEILELLGFKYSLSSNGMHRDGYGVDSKTIFAIMNNEDFSHDVFHYYSGKVNKRQNRNWITEEGIAYLWGNAYYTDKNGEMITQQRLVTELQNYLSKNPNTSLYELFRDNKNIFKHIAPEISVRSTIAGIIAQEIEKKKGNKAISRLINAGRKNRLENFLKVVNELIGINKNNFNVKVGKLVENY